MLTDFGQTDSWPIFVFISVWPNFLNPRKPKRQRPKDLHSDLNLRGPTLPGATRRGPLFLDLASAIHFWWCWCCCGHGCCGCCWFGLPWTTLGQTTERWTSPPSDRPKFRFFSTIFTLFVSLWVSSSFGLSCETPAAILSGPVDWGCWRRKEGSGGGVKPGAFCFGTDQVSHENSRTSKVHISGPGVSNTTKNQRRRHPERHKKERNGGGRGPHPSSAPKGVCSSMLRGPSSSFFLFFVKTNQKKDWNTNFVLQSLAFSPKFSANVGQIRMAKGLVDFFLAKVGLAKVGISLRGIVAGDVI